MAMDPFPVGNPSSMVSPDAAQAMAVGGNFLNTNQGLAGMYANQNTQMGNQIAQQQQNSLTGLKLDQANALYPGQIQNALGQQQAENMALVGQMAGQVSGLLKGVPEDQRPAVYQKLLSTSPQLAQNPLVQQIGQLPGGLMTNALDQISTHIAMADPKAAQQAAIQAQQYSMMGQNQLNLAGVTGQNQLAVENVRGQYQTGVAQLDASVRQQVAQLQSGTQIQIEQNRADAQKFIAQLQVQAARYQMTPEKYLTYLAQSGRISNNQLVNSLAYLNMAKVVPTQGIPGLPTISPVGTSSPFSFDNNSTSTAPGLAPGTSQGGYTFMGGDPSNPNSWKKN